jgi:6-phosphogluconolactonase
MLRRNHRRLAGARLVDRFSWKRLHWFWGNEHLVRPRGPARNFRMARKASLAPAPIPPGSMYPVPTVGTDPAPAAVSHLLARPTRRRAYRVAAGGGIGAEQTFALGRRCRLRTAGDTHRPGLRGDRREPAHIAFLVSGRGKRAILRKVLSGHGHVPGARLHPLGDLGFTANCDTAGE